jgi:hypothetical protein
MNLTRLETSNKRICQFYSANPSIHFEAVNLLFVDLFEKLLTDMDKTMTQTVHSQLLSGLSELHSSMSSLNQSMNHMQTDMTVTMLSRFSELKSDYIKETRSIIVSNNIDNITPFIEQNNSILIERTNRLIQELVPHQSKEIQSLLQTFRTSMAEDTSNLLRELTPQSIQDFLSQFEMKSNLLLQNMQQPIFSFITASEDRISNHIGALKESSLIAQQNQSKIVSELTELVGRFRSDQVSQQMIDRHLVQTLTRLFHTADISTSQQNPGQVLLKRQRKTPILIEHRESEDNIPMEDISPFLASVEEHHSHGIFLSQKSGIASKKNFQIELHNQFIIVFIHHGEYSSSKIEAAVDIIDGLAMRLKQIHPNSKEDCAIPKEVLDSINNEYQIFLSQKNAVVEVFKESQKKVLSQIDEFRFPCLDKFLATKYSAPIQKPGLKCDLCKSFCGNNLKALAAHKRGCIRKKSANITNVLTPVHDENVVNVNTRPVGPIRVSF